MNVDKIKENQVKLFGIIVIQIIGYVLRILFTSKIWVSVVNITKHISINS